MNAKLAVVSPLALLLCFALAGQALAQTRIVGVQPGDYFTFEIVTRWDSSNSSRTVPPSLVQINNTQWFNVTVSAVLGVNVSATNIWHFVNGTEIPSLVVLDVDSGQMHYMGGFQGFFYANLAVGDVLRPSAPPDNDSAPVAVSQTISREYASGRRDTNVASDSFPVTDFTNSSIGTETVTFYIDKATGVTVERYEYVEFPDENGSTTWTLSDTNLWDVTASTDFPLPLPVLIVIVIIVAVAVSAAVIHRVRKTRRRRRR